MTDSKTEYTWYYTDKHNGNYGVSQKDCTLRDFYLQLVGNNASKYLCGWYCYGEISEDEYKSLTEEEKKKYLEYYKKGDDEGYVYRHIEDVFTVMKGVPQTVLFEECADCSIYYIGNSSVNTSGDIEIVNGSTYGMFSGTKYLSLTSDDGGRGVFFPTQLLKQWGASQGSPPMHAFIWLTKKEGDEIKEYGMYYYEPSGVVEWSTASRMGIFKVYGPPYDLNKGEFTTGYQEFGLLLE